MEKLLSEVFEALAPYPVLQAAVAVFVIIVGTIAWRSGAGKKQDDDDGADGEHRRRIYQHVDGVEDKLRAEFASGLKEIDKTVRRLDRDVAVLKATVRRPGK